MREMRIAERDYCWMRGSRVIRLRTLVPVAGGGGHGGMDQLIHSGILP